MKKEIEAFVNAANEQELEAAWNNLSAEEQRVFEQLMEEEPVGAGSRAVFAAAGRNPALFSEVSTVSGIPVECKLLWSLNKIRSG